MTPGGKGMGCDPPPSGGGGTPGLGPPASGPRSHKEDLVLLAKAGAGDAADAVSSNPEWVERQRIPVQI